jgi:hypothetical protein
MKTLLTLLLATLCAAISYGQTMKALMYNTTNGLVVYPSSNQLVLSGNSLMIGDVYYQGNGINGGAFGGEVDFEENQFYTGDGNWDFMNSGIDNAGAISFNTSSNAATTRTNLGAQATLISGTNIKTINGQSILGAGDLVISGGTNTNSFNQSLNTTDDVTFNALNVSNKAATRTNLGLGGSNIVTFAGLTNNGDITINGTTATNGLLYIYRTNNEPFLGLANLIASNNTTISNETLFRVGTAEATNRSAQFGFRSTNTNGSGVAVFSVFGYNALMMIGADASTNAVIYSGGGTNNQVMTLIKSGVTEFARPISFANATDAATTRTNVGLPLAALTNTSNVTTMRALAGSTNTNQPFSGTVEFQNHTADLFFMEISNGIILRIYE